MAMNMGTSTSMAMDMGTATGTAAAASATATGSMSMSMEMGSSDCKISMLWNWYTIDACIDPSFIAKSWHITSGGMFAGSCIGVILLVMSLEFSRRMSKVYDRYIFRQAGRQQTQPSHSPERAAMKVSETERPFSSQLLAGGSANLNRSRFRPSFVQQVIRAALHMVQFTVAYFIMLLAMYYNGYIIISIIIGAFLGAFVFSWEYLVPGNSSQEATFCCG